MPCVVLSVSVIESPTTNQNRHQNIISKPKPDRHPNESCEPPQIPAREPRTNLARMQVLGHPTTACRVATTSASSISVCDTSENTSTRTTKTNPNTTITTTITTSCRRISRVNPQPPVLPPLLLRLRLHHPIFRLPVPAMSLRLDP